MVRTVVALEHYCRWKRLACVDSYSFPGLSHYIHTKSAREMLNWSLQEFDVQEFISSGPLMS